MKFSPENKFYTSLVCIGVFLISSFFSVFYIEQSMQNLLSGYSRSGQDNISWAFFKIESNYKNLLLTLKDYEKNPNDQNRYAVQTNYEVFVSSLDVIKNAPVYMKFLETSDRDANITLKEKSGIRTFQKINDYTNNFDKSVVDLNEFSDKDVKKLMNSIKNIQYLVDEIALLANIKVGLLVTDKEKEAKQLNIYMLYNSVFQIFLFIFFAGFSIVAIFRLKKSYRMLLQEKNKIELLNNSKDMLLASISHELRTPLNSIIGFSQILETEITNFENKQMVKSIKDSGWHLIQTIDDIMSFTQIKNNTNLKLEEVSLYDLIENCIKSLPVNNISISNMCDKKFLINSDVSKLKQIVINLLSNAIKYNKNDNPIFVQSEIVSNKLHIKIIDHGIGIKEEYKNSLFEPFNRLGYENSHIPGIGIGLSIVKRLSNLLKIDLTFESSVNVGTTFTLATQYYSIKEITNKSVFSIGNFNDYPNIDNVNIINCKINENNHDIINKINIENDLLLILIEYSDNNIEKIIELKNLLNDYNKDVYLISNVVNSDIYNFVLDNGFYDVIELPLNQENYQSLIYSYIDNN